MKQKPKSQEVCPLLATLSDRLTLSITVPSSLTDINSPRGLPFTGFSEHRFADMQTTWSLVDVNSKDVEQGGEPGWCHA